MCIGKYSGEQDKKHVAVSAKTFPVQFVCRFSVFFRPQKMRFSSAPSKLQLSVAVCVIAHLSAVNVTFITITSFQYLMVIPGYEAGIALIDRLYPTTIKVNHVVVYRRDIYSCQMMSEYMNDIAAQYLYVFMAPRKYNF
jgi:hypothetical protein